MRLIFLASLYLLAASGAHAEVTKFVVTDQFGNPVSSAVVSVKQGKGPQPGRVEAYEIRQKDLQFDPFVLVVPKGTEVAFPNLDKVRHHVYSFSKGNRFQLKLYGREQERYVTFKRAGVAALGCNIHDQMLAFIKIVDGMIAGTTNEQGEVTLDVPAGTQDVLVWHPFMQGKKDRRVTLGATVKQATGVRHDLILPMSGRQSGR